MECILRIVKSYYMGWLGYIVTSIIVHVAVIFVAFTNAVFLDAERDGAKWLKDWRNDD